MILSKCFKKQKQRANPSKKPRRFNQKQPAVFCITNSRHLAASKGIEVPVDPLGVKGLSAIMKFLGFECHPFRTQVWNSCPWFLLVKSENDIERCPQIRVRWISEFGGVFSEGTKLKVEKNFRWDLENKISRFHFLGAFGKISLVFQSSNHECQVNLLIWTRIDT